MIPNHSSFLTAIQERRKVCVRYFSKADNGTLDRVCAPMSYGPGGSVADGLNRYWLWDFAGSAGARTLRLLPQEILDLQVLGEVFDPAQFEGQPEVAAAPSAGDPPPRPDEASHRSGAAPTVTLEASPAVGMSGAQP